MYIKISCGKGNKFNILEKLNDKLKRKLKKYLKYKQHQLLTVLMIIFCPNLSHSWRTHTNFVSNTSHQIVLIFII